MNAQGAGNRTRPRAWLGLAAGRLHNPAMEIKSDNPEHGFQFPGTFELSAMGTAEKDLETIRKTPFVHELVKAGKG